MIGSFDVKSTQVFFYAQPQGNYDVRKSIIPFPKVKYNVGGGFNANGTFTAPVSGTYFFYFNGLNSEDMNDAEVRLYLNGFDQSIDSYASSSSETMTLDATLKLKKGDRVELILVYGTLETEAYNSFSGFLIEEDLSFSI